MESGRLPEESFQNEKKKHNHRQEPIFGSAINSSRMMLLSERNKCKRAKQFGNGLSHSEGNNLHQRKKMRYLVLTCLLIVFCYIVNLQAVSELHTSSSLQSETEFKHSSDLQIVERARNGHTNARRVHKEKKEYLKNTYSGRNGTKILLDMSKVPVLYINLDSSKDRRGAIEKDFFYLPSYISSKYQLQRVHAITTKSVQEMLKEGTLLLNNNVTLTLTRQPHEHTPEASLYLFSETACALSHFSAVKRAYDEGYEFAIILEDDAIISKDFLEHLHKYLSLAPMDWKILQLATSNASVNRRQLYKNNDFWVAWQPYYWSANAYIINREGMKKILDRVFRKLETGVEVWEFAESRVHVSDEMLYFTAKESYSFTYPLVACRSMTSTMAAHDITDATNYDSVEFLPYVPLSLERDEVIAVVMNLFLVDEIEVEIEMKKIKADKDMLAKYNPRSKWFVHVILPTERMVSYFNNLILSFELTEELFFVEKGTERLNQFLSVSKMQSRLGGFDYVLFKDKDFRISGFAWNSFMTLKGDSIISGPFRENVETNLFGRQEELRRVNFQSVYFNVNIDSIFQDVAQSYPTMHLGSFFALVKQDFAIWYFDQIKVYLDPTMEWGVDLMWCGAAQAYNDASDTYSSSICSLVPVSLADHRRKHEILQKSKLEEIYEIVLTAKYQSNETLAKWLHASSSIKPGIFSKEKLVDTCDKLGFFAKNQGLSQCGAFIAQKAVDRMKISKPLSESAKLVSKIYTCGYPFGEKLHVTFFPELQNKIRDSTELYPSKNLLSTLIHAEPNDLLITGGVGGCINSQGDLMTESEWHDWLAKNYKGKYITYNGEAHGGEPWILGKAYPRQFHVGYGRDRCQSTMMYYFVIFLNYDMEKKDFDLNVIMDRKKKPRSTQEHFLIYTNSHCVGFREDAFLALSQSFNNSILYHGGPCKGENASDMSLKEKYQYQENNIRSFGSLDRSKWASNEEMYSHFRFCLVMENSFADGYITEKILEAFLGGCIPIYYGTEQVFDIFNPRAFIYYNISDPSNALNRIAYLERNNTAFNEVMNETILTRENVFENHIALDGDLKMRVRDMIDGKRCHETRNSGLRGFK